MMSKLDRWDALIRDYEMKFDKERYLGQNASSSIGCRSELSECCDCDGMTFAMPLQIGMPVDVSFSAGWCGM